MEDGGDQSFVDAAQLTVNHTLQDGAEASPFGHHLWILQGYRGSKSVTEILDRVRMRFDLLSAGCAVQVVAPLSTLKTFFHIFFLASQLSLRQPAVLLKR